MFVPGYGDITWASKLLLVLAPQRTSTMMFPQGSFLGRTLQITATRYVLAILATLLAVLLRAGLNPVLGTYVPYITFFPAVAFSAWYCGIAPAALATILAELAAQYWFVPPTHSMRVAGTEQFVGILAFLLVSGIIIAISETHRHREHALRIARGELELQVEQRTTELNTANQSLRDLTSRLLQLQDDERRRIARELHDSVGQMLVALNMNLSALGSDIERLARTASTVKDSTALVDNLTTEIRTISHLLHPPLLDEAGLSSALRWYVDGFAERSKIKVDLEIAPDLGRLSRELETAIFRVVQECLTNIHRHSESPSARIRVTRAAHDIRVEVRDCGKGIAAEKRMAMESAGTPGVGVRGMRERMRQLGGNLDIDSGGNGTCVVAQLPIGSSSSTAAA
jgi:signal transduction histidine kinase